MLRVEMYLNCGFHTPRPQHQNPPADRRIIFEEHQAKFPRQNPKIPEVDTLAKRAPIFLASEANSCTFD